MMTTAALARETGTSLYTVRHYTRIGLLRPVRGSNNYRFFDTAEISRLRFISAARQLGFTLNEISRILQEADAGASPCPNVRTMITARLEETTKRISELQALEAKMRDALEVWEELPDLKPANDSVCHLIESVAA